MKLALTTFVVCSVLAGGAMADANTDLYLQLKKNGESIPQWLIDLENPRTPADDSRAGGGEDFGTAELIPSLPFSGVGNTTGMAANIDLSCDSSTQRPDAVYLYVPTANMCVNVSLCGSGYDTVLGVFENATQIGCNDDNGPLCSGSRSSLANVNLIAGNAYYFVVDGWSGGGAFVLDVSACPPPPTPPANDNMADATEVVVDGPCATGSTLLATADNMPPLFQHACYSGFYSAASSGASVDTWHWFTSTGGCYNVTLCGGTTWDTALALFEADGTPIASNDDACSLTSTINSYAAGCWLPAGQILVAVDGYSSAKGDYTLCVTSCTASDTDDQPVSFELGKAFPNPFNPSTTINFTMGETAQANLTVYNMNGQAVATLVDGVVSAGAQSVVFDASELTSGVYFYTLNAAGQSMTEKMVLVK